MAIECKIIFLEGVDGAGKTTRAYKLLSSHNPDLLYFRSSYQNHSIFAGEKVNLEESIKHDWRILLDFISQTIKNKIILVDRGFISSYVYSKVLRNTDILKWILEYERILGYAAEYWMFIREDDEMTEEEYQINEEFKRVAEQLKTKYNVKLFVRKNNNVFTSDSFLDLKTEIIEGRFDVVFYTKLIHSMMQQAHLDEKTRPIIVTDIDGTLVDSDYPLGENFSIKYNVIKEIYMDDAVYILLTGRIQVSDNLLSSLSSVLNVQPDNFYVIQNNRNIGLSSRVLKEFCLSQISKYVNEFIYLEDRVDVIQFLREHRIKMTDLGIIDNVYIMNVHG